MTDIELTKVPPVYEIKLKALAPKDVWTLHSADGGRRLTLKPVSIEVVGWKPLKSHLRLSIHVAGRVIRQSDGELTTLRRSVAFNFDDDDEATWITAKLSEASSLDPELRAFALDARRRIELALGLTGEKS